MIKNIFEGIMVADKVALVQRIAQNPFLNWIKIIISEQQFFTTIESIQHWNGWVWFLFISDFKMALFVSFFCTTYTLTCATWRIFKKFSKIFSGSVAGANRLPPFEISRVPDISWSTGLFFVPYGLWA
jgi:hypothetical protein